MRRLALSSQTLCCETAPSLDHRAPCRLPAHETAEAFVGRCRVHSHLALAAEARRRRRRRRLAAGIHETGIDIGQDIRRRHPGVVHTSRDVAVRRGEIVIGPVPTRARAHPYVGVLLGGSALRGGHQATREVVLDIVVGGREAGAPIQWLLAVRGVVLIHAVVRARTPTRQGPLEAQAGRLAGAGVVMTSEIVGRGAVAHHKRQRPQDFDSPAIRISVI